MSYKINSLEYLGSVNLARLYKDPAAIVARGSNAACDVNRTWFYPLFPEGTPGMVTIVPTPEGVQKEMEEYGGSGVVDFDVKGDAYTPWYVISIEGSDFGPAVSVYIPDGAPEAERVAVRAAWEAGNAQ